MRLGSRALALALVLSLLPFTTVHAADVPPPTPVPPAGKPSPFPTSIDPGHVSARRAPVVGAPSALLADLDTGQVLYEKRPGLRRPIASLTKVMTALVVLEEEKPDATLTVDREAVLTLAEGGYSLLELEAGEKISVEDLLYGLMLQSSNDAAVALADAVAGNSKSFVQEMNRRAKELGLRDTHFASPNGLNDHGYSTAADLVLITRTAMEQPVFAEIVRTKFATMPGASAKDPPRKIQNRNVLLWLYPGAIGVKTGYTNLAGYNVIAAAERDERRLLAVVLGEGGEPFSDAAELLNFGFKAFEQRTVLEEGQDFGVRRIGGEKVRLAAGESLSALVPKGEEVATHVQISAASGKPSAGEEVGVITASVQSLELGAVPLVVSEVVLVIPRRLREPSAWSFLVTAVGDLFS